MPKPKRTCLNCHCFSLCEVRNIADGLHSKMLPFLDDFPTKISDEIQEFIATRCGRYLLDKDCRKEE